MTKPVPHFLRCDWADEDAYAMQALARGEASPEQQRRVLDWVINQGARYYDISFQLEGDRESAFAEGRRFVGAQVIKLTKLNINAMRKARQNG